MRPQPSPELVVGERRSPQVGDLSVRAREQLRRGLDRGVRGRAVNQIKADQ
jgi:hypothetical protein